MNLKTLNIRDSDAFSNVNPNENNNNGISTILMHGGEMLALTLVWI
jgi:hypothetical protein